VGENRQPAPFLRPAEAEAPWQALTEVKRSRFLALVSRATGEDEARAFIARVRADHPDARHHCSAFILHVGSANPVERSSDDGEPSGTAGQPILEVLRGSGMEDVVAVVVRWFGGVKLGTGGLARAYRDVVKEAVDKVRVVRREPRALWVLTVPYAAAGRLEADLRNRGCQVTASYSSTSVELTLAVDAGDDPTGTVAGLTGGEVPVHRAGEQWCDVQVSST